MQLCAIRRATTEDADKIAEIFIDARKRSMPYLPDLHTDEQVESWIKNHVVPDLEVYVAEKGDVIIGFMGLLGDSLDHLYVQPEHHNSGVGTALLEVAKNCRPAGFRLWVFQQNTQARKFYESKGLSLIELTDGSKNQEKLPDALYGWFPVGT